MLKVYIVIWVVANVIPVAKEPERNPYGVLSVQSFGVQPRDSYEYYHPIKVVRDVHARGFFSRDSALAFIANAPRKPSDTTLVGTGWVDWTKLDSTFLIQGNRVDSAFVPEVEIQ